MISADGGRTAVKSKMSSKMKTVPCAIDKGQAISSLWMVWYGIVVFNVPLDTL